MIISSCLVHSRLTQQEKIPPDTGNRAKIIEMSVEVKDLRSKQTTFTLPSQDNL